MPAIEKFFEKVVRGQSAMYSGKWEVNDEQDQVDSNGLLSKAFGASFSDLLGQESANAHNGKSRSFMIRQSTNGESYSLMNFFGGHSDSKK